MRLYFAFAIVGLLTFTISYGQEKQQPEQPVTADWNKDTNEYANQIIPGEIEYSGNNYHLTPINLKRTAISKLDNQPVVVAICTVETVDGDKSALTYYLINPKTNKLYPNGTAVITVKGCKLDIPAFTFKDVNNDGKDEFIFIKSYDDKCKGEYWIAADIVAVNRPRLENDLDNYLKLRNNTSLNRRIEKTDTAAIQKTLEEVVKLEFGK